MHIPDDQPADRRLQPTIFSSPSGEPKAHAVIPVKIEVRCLIQHPTSDWYATLFNAGPACSFLAARTAFTTSVAIIAFGIWNFSVRWKVIVTVESVRTGFKTTWCPYGIGKNRMWVEENHP